MCMCVCEKLRRDIRILKLLTQWMLVEAFALPCNECGCVYQCRVGVKNHSFTSHHTELLLAARLGKNVPRLMDKNVMAKFAKILPGEILQEASKLATSAHESVRP